MATTSTAKIYYRTNGEAAATSEAQSLSLATSVDSAIGLVPLTPTSTGVDQGSSSVSSDGAVTFLGANTIRINGVFSANYSNYRIMFSQLGASAGSVDYHMRLRASGTDSTTGYYLNGIFGIDSTVSGYNSGNDNKWLIGATHPATYPTGHCSAVIDIFNPFPATLAQEMHVTSQTWTGASNKTMRNTAFNNGFISYDGFSFVMASGTFSGVIRIYGYR